LVFVKLAFWSDLSSILHFTSWINIFHPLSRLKLSIMTALAQTGDRAHEKLCTIINPGLPLQVTTLQLDEILQKLARQAEQIPCEAPGSTIVDCSCLTPNVVTSALYSIWITRVSTPGLFSVTCVCEHIRKQMIENGKVIMPIFNETGGYGKAGEALAAGTYMVVLKRIDTAKLRCVPVSFSTMEKKAIGEYLLQHHSSSERGREE
ncbi:hypothetical protein DM02DRAFT_191429, partial [Periconia macrospinosa]